MKRNYKYVGSGKDGTLRRVSANLTTWPAKVSAEPVRPPYGWVRAVCRRMPAQVRGRTIEGKVQWLNEVIAKVGFVRFG